MISAAIFCSILITAAIVTLNHSCQAKALGIVFYAFVALGLANVIYIETVVYVPVLWVVMTLCLNAMSWRTFSASLLGMAVPWLFAAAIYYLNDYQTLSNALVTSARDVLTKTQVVVSAVIIALIALASYIYLTQVWRKRKVVARLRYYSTLIVTTLTLILSIIFPTHGMTLLAVAALTTLYGSWILSPYY